jgi:glycosyltransferase involved in cell wall biosynthesis
MIDKDNSDISVGVIVPCYNHGKYLHESVTSILSQTHENTKILIVNDGSNDETNDVVQSLISENSNKTIGYMSFDENCGKWHRLNQAIAKLDCPFITTQDADDVSLPERIERQLQCLLETQTLHNLCGFYHCYNDGDINTHRLKRADGPDLAIMQSNEVSQHVLEGLRHSQINHYYTGQFETAGASAMFHRNVWQLGTRFNPPDVGLRVLNSEDSDFNFRVTINTAATSVLLEKLYCYRRNTSTNDQRK